VLDYDAEAVRYDDTRGGVPRAAAAAQAVLGLVPEHARTLLDVACGTGLVTARYARPGLRVLGLDAALGMARMAARRVGPAVVLGDSRRLPFATGRLDAVSAVWLLHLLPDAAAVVAECARVLRPGGVFIATVDKDAAHDVGSDIDALLAPFRTRRAYDAEHLVAEYGARHGLRPHGEALFTGYGQGRSPLRTAADIESGYFASSLAVDAAGANRLIERLRALPDPDKPRPDPVYRLLALRRTLSTAVARWPVRAPS
jgi:SAM-dependent methyltransferase